MKLRKRTRCVLVKLLLSLVTHTALFGYNLGNLGEVSLADGVLIVVSQSSTTIEFYKIYII